MHIGLAKGLRQRDNHPHSLCLGLSLFELGKKDLASLDTLLHRKALREKPNLGHSQKQKLYTRAATSKAHLRDNKKNNFQVLKGGGYNSKKKMFLELEIQVLKGGGETDI